MENFKNKKDEALWSAASSGDIDKVKKALAEGADVNGANYLNMTPLHAVLESETLEESVQSEIVKILVEAGADLEIISELGQNPLKLAVANGKFEVFKYLHEKGADIFIETEDGDNLIYEAVDRFNPGFEIFSGTEEGREEIHKSANSSGYIKIIEFLIKKGVDVNAKKEESGQTALFRAADLGYPETVSALLKAKNIELNIADDWGLRPLHYASRGGHLEIVKLLVEAGAEVNVQEDYGFTPMHEAAENGRLEVIKYLIENKADTNIGLKSGFDAYEAGDKPVDIAQKAYQNEVADYLEKI